MGTIGQFCILKGQRKIAVGFPDCRIGLGNLAATSRPHNLRFVFRNNSSSTHSRIPVRAHNLPADDPRDSSPRQHLRNYESRRERARAGAVGPRLCREVRPRFSRACCPDASSHPSPPIFIGLPTSCRSTPALHGTQHARAMKRLTRRCGHICQHSSRQSQRARSRTCSARMIRKLSAARSGGTTSDSKRRRKKRSGKCANCTKEKRHDGQT